MYDIWVWFLLGFLAGGLAGSISVAVWLHKSGVCRW